MQVEVKKHGITKIISLIRIDNNASKKLFEKNNYKLKLNWFEKQLD